MSSECHWKVRLASQRSKRLYLDWERLLRRLETNRTLFEVVPSGGRIPRWVFPTERGGAVKPQESAVFIPNWRDRRAYPGSTTRREVSTTVVDQGEGSGGGPPLTYFRPNWGPKGQKNLFYKSPPLSQGLDDRFPTPPPPTPPYPRAVPLKYIYHYISVPTLKDCWICFLHWLANLSRLTSRLGWYLNCWPKESRWWFIKTAMGRSW